MLRNQTKENQLFGPSRMRHPLIVYESALRMTLSNSRSRPHRNSRNQKLARRSAIVRVGAVEEAAAEGAEPVASEITKKKDDEPYLTM